ncbi:probable ubiquitin carboxyl-terminal hydrolase MINDY-4 [Nephila pilipes]|uniref:Ubiquitin carboxyl-terminal hydrolase MINDY n=1 Tax=Nephila pilipes TaxID=299642 RepID=A0A8X6PDD4_NEPPI|nr:probable ubiquitin carboxyl-terminal hydrolase MINDY-4 [Nephila pilipes]
MNVKSTEESASHFYNIPCDILSSVRAEERSITMDEACALRLLLFGNTRNSFSAAWTEQGFHFRSVPPYGFIQKKAGPCGVLAAVQAYVIYELLFGISHVDASFGLLRLKSSQKVEALARALASILWQAGDSERAIVAMKRNNAVESTSTSSAVLEIDGILEHLQLKYFECKSCLLEFFVNSKPEVMSDHDGSCIYFLYSLILTKGVEKIRKEMDYPECHLIGNDGYCSQEIINLILIGKAVPNLFDGDVELNSGGSENTRFHGIPSQSRIGLLSLYEYQETCTVGDNLKYPKFPIWILLADSHFTVLFAASQKVLKKKFKKSFVLYHYDGLAKRFAETSFTIDPASYSVMPEKNRSLPIVVQCIYTRWPYASIQEIEEPKE